MTGQGVPSRQVLRERLEFIEFRLLWEGRINRRDLVLRFGISEAQASSDLRRFQEMAGEGVAYDVSAKTYVPTARLRDRDDSAAEHYLAQLALVAGGSPSSFGWISSAPNCAVIPRGRRPVQTHVLRPVLTAIRSNARLHLEYQSLSADVPRWRWISPHALVDDGFRWHVRAWCYERSEFRDFVMSRMIAMGELEAGGVSAALDDEWSTFVTLVLAPHPHLSEQAKEAVALDYNMTGGLAHLSSRACLVRYVKWMLRLEVPESDKPAFSTQVVLANRGEVEEACHAARERGTAGGRAATL